VSLEGVHLEDYRGVGVLRTFVITHIHTSTHTHTYTHTYTHTHTHKHTHTGTHTHKHKYKQTHTHTFIDLTVSSMWTIRMTEAWSIGTT